MNTNNPYKLEVGKYYWVKYIHCQSSWERVLITRFTVNGYPWAAWNTTSGIISPGCYKISENDPSTNTIMDKEKRIKELKLIIDNQLTNCFKAGNKFCLPTMTSPNIEFTIKNIESYIVYSEDHINELKDYINEFKQLNNYEKTI